MAEIGLLKAAGAVAFTDGAKSVTNAQVMRRALTYARDFDALVVHHTEDPDLIGDGVMNEGEFAARLGLFGIPQGRRDHHAGARHPPRRARPARAITPPRSPARNRSTCCARAKEAGLPVTAAASINHLTLNEIDIGAYRTFFKMSPPLRAEEDRAALVEALRDGLIDVVMSDHNPQDVETKRLPFAEAAPGAIGLETMLAAGAAPRPQRRDDARDAAARRCRRGRPSCSACRPARCEPGAPADVIVVDIDAPWVLDPDELKSKCKNTPFDEARLQGRVLRTIVAGRTVFEYASA